jgi:hypothetical protein
MQQEREPTPAEKRLAEAQEWVAHQVALIEDLLVTGRDIRLAWRVLQIMQQVLDSLRGFSGVCACGQAEWQAAAAGQAGALVTGPSR